MLKDSQVDLCGRTDFTRTAPLLARDEAFSFAVSYTHLTLPTNREV